MYYDLLLKHTEEILPFIYTVSRLSVWLAGSVAVVVGVVGTGCCASCDCHPQPKAVPFTPHSLNPCVCVCVVFPFPCVCLMSPPCAQPTVGEACENYHKLPLKTRGMYLTLHDKGRVAERLADWPAQDIKVVVITDGERILGLGKAGMEREGRGLGVGVGEQQQGKCAQPVRPGHQALR